MRANPWPVLIPILPFDVLILGKLRTLWNASVSSQQCKENSSTIQSISLCDTFRWLQALSNTFKLSVVQPVPIDQADRRGALGFSVLRIWPSFGSVFRFSQLTTAVFRFWGLPRFAGFLEFSLWYSVFVNNDGGFSHFFVHCILRFFWFCQRSYTPQSR